MPCLLYTSETEPAESKKKPSGAPLPAAVFAAVKETAPELQPEPVPQPKKTEQPEKQPVVDFFGKAQSEDAPQAPLAPAEEPAAKEDTMRDVYKRQMLYWFSQIGRCR